MTGPAGPDDPGADSPALLAYDMAYWASQAAIEAADLALQAAHEEAVRASWVRSSVAYQAAQSAHRDAIAAATSAFNAAVGRVGRLWWPDGPPAEGD